LNANSGSDASGTEVTGGTPRRKVEGLGGGHHGAGVWLKERASSVALVILGVWGLWSATRIAGTGFDGAVEWLHAPINAVLMLLLVLTSLYHMHLGLRVVIEDYVHKPFGKGALLMLNLFLCLVLAAVAAFAVLKVAFGGEIGA
jgi:succinate dehydrogenase / fumarate reductase membrane anchor subunit